MNRIAGALGLLSGLGFVAVTLAGSDWPPPTGFAVCIVLGVVLGVGVAVLLPMALRVWQDRGALAALWRTAAVGLVAAVVCWAVLWALPFTGVSHVQPADVVIGFLVVGAVGALGATGAVVVGRLLSRA